MEVQEAIKLSLEAEEKIHAILHELQQKTGMRVASVTVFATSVRVKLEI